MFLSKLDYAQIVHHYNSKCSSTQHVLPLEQGFSNSVLESHCPAEFSSNPDQTHLPVSFY